MSKSEQVTLTPEEKQQVLWTFNEQIRTGGGAVQTGGGLTFLKGIVEKLEKIV